VTQNEWHKNKGQENRVQPFKPFNWLEGFFILMQMWNSAVSNALFRRLPSKDSSLPAQKTEAVKPTVTVDLLASLTKRGFSVAPFKVGPDFFRGLA